MGSGEFNATGSGRWTSRTVLILSWLQELLAGSFSSSLQGYPGQLCRSGGGHLYRWIGELYSSQIPSDPFGNYFWTPRKPGFQLGNHNSGLLIKKLLLILRKIILLILFKTKDTIRRNRRLFIPIRLEGLGHDQTISHWLWRNRTIDEGSALNQESSQIQK